MKPYKCYIKVCAITVAVGGILLSAFNYLVDPYGIYRSVHFNFNQRKPYASTQIRASKAYGLRLSRPLSVSLGNSRVDIGLDPLSDAWPEGSKPNYNLGIPGGELYTSLKYLEYALKISEVRYVVMGIDFMDFPVSAIFKKQREIDEFEKRLCADAQCYLTFDYISQRVKDVVMSLASLTATIDSVLTVFNQRGADTTPLGFNPLGEYEDYVQKEGHHSLFLQRDIENVRSYLKKTKSLVVMGTTSSPQFENLRKIIRTCSKKEIRLYLYIHPYHARLNETIKVTGFWPFFEEWKRQVVTLLEEERKNTGVSATLWDFSGYNCVTTEKVPAPGDTNTKMKWYWEAGHYKKETGDLMLNMMFNGPSKDTELSGNFGVPLDSQNLKEHLLRIRREQENYVANNFETAHEISEVKIKLAQE